MKSKGKKSSDDSAGAARGGGRGGASGLGPAPGISKRSLNRSVLNPTSGSEHENLETNLKLQNKKHFTDRIGSLIEEGHLNNNFLTILHTKASHPYFVGNLIHLFFIESEKLLVELADAINNHSEIDLKKVDKLLKQLKAKCSRIGVQKVHDDCIGFINSPDGCRYRLSILQMHYHILKNFTFDLFFDMEKFYLARGGTYPL